MRRLLAADLLNWSVEQMWNAPDEKFALVFDDGEIVTTMRRTVFSYYHWEVHRQYPKTPLLRKHHMGNGYLEATTSLKILSSLARNVHEAYGDSINREHLWKLFYEIVNEIYNVFSVNLEAYQTTADILDFLEIFDHPDISQANREIRPTQISLDRTYSVIEKTLMEKDDLIHNPVVQATRAKLVSLGQVSQTVGPRGFMTDADSNIFRKPITVGYFQGITNLADSMMESRSAVKALTFTKKPLRQVEYFNRKMQLSTSNVKNVIHGDCGSESYVTAKVTANLLKGMEGKYYRVKGKGLHAVSLDDTHLIGTTVEFRSPMKCHFRGGGNCCQVCMGEIVYSIPEGTNLGHVSSTEMCQEGSQLVMSVKHYDGSSKVGDIVLSEHDAKYLVEGSETGVLKINPRIMSAKPYIIMESTGKSPVEGAAGIATLTKTTNIRDLSIHRITTFREVVFGVVSNDGAVMEDYVSVSLGSRLGSLTHEFLEFIMDKGYTITDTGDYRVELEGWDYDHPVFELPLRHLNMLDYMSGIEVFLRSPTDASRDVRIGSSKKLIEYNSMDEALLDLYELASSKLSVNIAHLEVMLTSMMRSASDPNDYRIPAFGEPVMFERHNRLMEMRSLGAAMAYERQPSIIDDVDSYLITNRDSHIYDPMLL